MQTGYVSAEYVTTGEKAMKACAFKYEIYGRDPNSSVDALYEPRKVQTLLRPS